MLLPSSGSILSRDALTEQCVYIIQGPMHEAHTHNALTEQCVYIIQGPMLAFFTHPQKPH
ncbi:hypothetical protein DPMN_122242 [Dreissena polymorpha]|uniref:Cupin domain-containing protein n=1 Tax=Dreissena polymorpha TaxID=45954 RepID=A0A9D4GS59_DREPO|nr:hypothetical protein DPMN_122242 [Dreissena polymorpha]